MPPSRFLLPLRPPSPSVGRCSLLQQRPFSPSRRSSLGLEMDEGRGGALRFRSAQQLVVVQDQVRAHVIESDSFGQVLEGD